MALSTKKINQSIKSIKSTKKMTKAMELVAASKMRKTIEYVLASRTYSELAWEILNRLRSKTDPKLHKLLTPKKEVKNVLIILLTSNRGLCGGYNAQILQKTIYSIAKHKDIAKTDFILVGKKGRDVADKLHHDVIAYFDKEDVIGQINEIYPITQILFEEYLADKYDKVLIAYNDFFSTLKQVPRVRQLLPFTDKDEYIGMVSSGEALGSALTGTKDRDRDGDKDRDGELKLLDVEYMFEPNTDEILKELLPRLVETQIYQAYLEANASEHSARMLAMRNASDAAEDMIFDLQLTFNKARQAAITGEIAEISAGKAVLEG